MSFFSSLHNHSGIKKYLSNSVWIIAEQALKILSGIFVGALVARHLGASQFGTLSYILAFTSIFSSIIRGGLESIIVREIAYRPEKTGEILASSFSIRTSLFIICEIILIIFISLSPSLKQIQSYLLVFSLSFAFHAFEVYEGYFQAKVQYRFISICKIIQLAFSIIFKIFAVYTSKDLFFFVTLYVFDQIILSLAIYIAFKLNKDKNISLQFDKEITIKLLKHGSPMLMASFATMVQARFDQILLNNMATSTELGNYSVALRLTEALCLIPMIIHSSLFPALANSKRTSSESYENRLSNYYRLMMIAFLPFSVLQFFFGDKIIIFLYGNSFKHAELLFQLMSIRLFFAYCGIARSSFLILENLQAYSMVSTYVGTFANIVLNYFFIRKHGALGAIWSSIISYTLTTFILDLFSPKTRQNTFKMLKSMIYFYKIDLKLK